MSKRCSSVEVATFFLLIYRKIQFPLGNFDHFPSVLRENAIFRKKRKHAQHCEKIAHMRKKRAKSAVEVQFQPFLFDFSHFSIFDHFSCFFFDFVDFCVIFQILLKICDFNDFLRFSRLRGISPAPPRGAHGELS